MAGSKLEQPQQPASGVLDGEGAPPLALPDDPPGAGAVAAHNAVESASPFAVPPLVAAEGPGDDSCEAASFPPPRRGELSPDAIQTARPEARDDGDPRSAGTERVAPLPAALPSIATSGSERAEEDTLVAPITDEIRRLQKGYRHTSPRDALRPPSAGYDDSAQIEVHAEDWLDGLLAADLLDDEPAMAEAGISVGAYGLSDQGRRRKRNEDALLLLPDHHVYLVADGMGGHAAGEVASQTAAETTREAFARGRFLGEPNVLWPAAGDELARTLEMANATIFGMASADEGRAGMGTTVTALRVSPDRQRAYIAHVGDSRCYRFRRGELTRLTTDHTVGQLFGVTGPMAGHLCRAVGIEPDVEVDLLVDRPEPGDLYLLCSDGLTKMVEESSLREHLDPSRELPVLVGSLVDAANASGGVDNITVLAVRIATR